VRSDPPLLRPVENIAARAHGGYCTTTAVPLAETISMPLLPPRTS
jgi:hypothetical protein